MRSFFSIFRRFEEALDRFVGRRPGLARNALVYGWLVLVSVGLLVVVGSAVAVEDRSQQIVYATRDGSIAVLEPESGETTMVYEGNAEGYATGLSRSGGSRSLAFTVLKEERGLRGDLYSADLVRRTRALTKGAAPGEVFAFPDFSEERSWVLASRFAGNSPPNVIVLPVSGATERLLEPALSPGAPAILGPLWTYEEALYAWKTDGPEESSLAAYEPFERRQTAVYSTGGEVGLPVYYRDANALIFAGRPRGADLSASRLKLFVGTGELPVSGAEGLGLYDPSPPVGELDDELAVMWTDGERNGVGFLDPEGWVFRESGINVEPGSRSPLVSDDGRYLATASAAGTEIVIRRISDGSVVRRVRDVQPPDAALRRMREAGIEVPPEADWFVPASFDWRSLEDP